MPRIAKEKAPSAPSTATIGFESRACGIWLTAEQAVPAPHLADAECNGARPEGLLGLIFPGAGLKIAWGPAARDFGRGQGGEAGGASRTGHSPQRAVTAEPTPATGKRPAAPRGFGEKAGRLRCSSVGDRCGYPPSSRLAIQPFPRKQDFHGISRPAPEYISDTFEEHRAKLLAGSTRAPRVGSGAPADPLDQFAGANAEDPDEYKAENVFWVPADARWSHLQASAKQPTIGKIVDDAMVAIERDNPRLKGVLPKDYARPGLDKQRLGELIDVIATIELTAASEGEKTHRSVDLLGRVYEYFLTRFASAEGKNGGVAKCEIRSASVEVKTSRPFVIRNSSFGISPARRLAVMNLALRGIEADFVDCMVALPGQLFYSTQIPVCLWFLAKNKSADAKCGFHDRRQPIAPAHSTP